VEVVGKNEGREEALCWCGKDVGDDGGEMSIAENFFSSPPIPGGRAFDVEVLEAVEVFEKEVVVVAVFDKEPVVGVDFSEEGGQSSFLFAFPLPLPDIGKKIDLWK
jgi:hypothetical protein